MSLFDVRLASNRQRSDDVVRRVLLAAVSSLIWTRSKLMTSHRLIRFQDDCFPPRLYSSIWFTGHTTNFGLQRIMTNDFSTTSQFGTMIYKLYYLWTKWYSWRYSIVLLFSSWSDCFIVGMFVFLSTGSSPTSMMYHCYNLSGWLLLNYWSMCDHCDVRLLFRRSLLQWENGIVFD